MEFNNELIVIKQLLKDDYKNGRFYNYKPSSVIAEQILTDFKPFFEEGKGVPLYLRQGTKAADSDFGIISNCMALSTLLELAAMDADLQSFDKQFKFLIEDVFNRVEKNGFDASPYLSDLDGIAKLSSYVESASIICTVMIDLRSFAISNAYDKKEFGASIKIGESVISDYDKLAEKAEKLMTEAMRVLTKACLRVEEDIDYRINGTKVNRLGLNSEIKYRGWSFQKPSDSEANKYGESVFYTYHATNAFISLYNEFRRQFENAKGLDTSELNKDAFNAKEKNRQKRNKDFFESKEELFETFKKQTASAGRYFETMIRKNQVNLFTDYVRNDFKKVSFEQIVDSQKTYYVMDTLFVLAILINAGIDEDYESVGLQSYFYELVQSSLTNIKKIYNELKRIGREDAINTYNPQFSESYPKSQQKIVQELRKKCSNFSVFEFVPLLCNTHKIIFDFLIQYPQKDMIDNLMLIMENKAANLWYWNNDGFNVISNLYYVFALENFYIYYDEYERPLSDAGVEYNKIAEEALKNQEAVQELLAIKEKEYVALQKLYDEKSSALDDEVAKIANRVIENCFEEKMDEYISQLFSDFYELISEVHRSCDSEDNSKLLLLNHPKAKKLLEISVASELREFGELSSLKAGKVEEKIIKKVDDALLQVISDIYQNKGV